MFKFAYFASLLLASMCLSHFKTKIMEMARLAFQHGLYQGATDANFVGIEAGDGKVLGNPGNVKLRFASTWLGQGAL
ncbi:MAG TPA: hypothetical protein VGC62_22540 [Pseudomonas sp.]|uniref:hypothetical protein n=1 Tax=Pseudomonas sp. TaxID=306 RepID=UPI002EDB1958